jgi:hypothetical protein
MRKIAVFLWVASLLAAASLPSCRNTKQQAIDYNNRIVDLQSKIVKGMLDFSSTFDSKDTALMEKKYGELQASIDAALKETRTLEPFDGSSEFRDTAIQLFEFYRDITKKEYREIVDIFKKSQIQQTDVDRIGKLNEDISKREKVLDDRFMAVQTSFAKKYGIPLVESELQKKIDNM